MPIIYEHKCFKGMLTSSEAQIRHILALLSVCAEISEFSFSCNLSTCHLFLYQRKWNICCSFFVMWCEQT